MTDIRPELIEKALTEYPECLPAPSGWCTEHGSMTRGESCEVAREITESVITAVADDLRAEALRKAAGDDELWKLTEGEQRLLDANTPYYEGVAYGFRIARSLLKDHADQIARADK